MNDLLSDSFVSDAKSQPPSKGRVKMAALLRRSNSNMALEAFNKQIQEFREQVDKLSSVLKKMEDSIEESKTINKASAMKAFKKRMDRYVDEEWKIARNVKAKVEAINKENLANRKKPGCEKGTGVDRSRMNITNMLTKKFKELLGEFQTLRQKIQDDHRVHVERIVITVTGTRPDEETINRLIETGESEQIFQKAVQGMGRGHVLNTLEEIPERNDAEEEIEKKLHDLVLIYLDMANQVEGEILDNIESQVTNAVDHVNTDTDALNTAQN